MNTPVSAASPVYRIPPYSLGPKVYMASELDDVIDWGLQFHGIENQWAKSEGEGVIIGVADTGRPDHPDLNDNILASRNFSSSYTDKDTQGHSTHVCGTIAAIRNGQGVVGVAPKAKIVTAKVLGDDGSGSNASVSQGIRWLVNKGCHVINLSLGGPFDESIASACRDAVDAGVFLICAAGNDGHVPGQNTVGYPAKLPFTVAVASYNKAGELSEYSSRGPEVHIAFPGEDIMSCWPGGGYRRISGTSMASPFCAAVTANRLSYQKALAAGGQVLDNPIENNQQLIGALQSSAIDKGPEGRDSGWGWGIMDVDKFMTIPGKSPSPPVDDDDGDKPKEPDAPSVENPSEMELFFGLVKVRYPVEIDGKQGAFLYPN